MYGLISWKAHCRHLPCHIERCRDWAVELLERSELSDEVLDRAGQGNDDGVVRYCNASRCVKRLTLWWVYGDHVVESSTYESLIVLILLWYEKTRSRSMTLSPAVPYREE